MTQKQGVFFPLRAWVFTALLVVTIAAGVGIVGSRSARAADVPQNPVPLSPAQVASALAAGQALGSPAMGAAFKQILWGGTKDDGGGKGNKAADADPPPIDRSHPNSGENPDKRSTAKSTGEAR